jgi:AraC-like DNA-binding protein
MANHRPEPARPATNSEEAGTLAGTEQQSDVFAFESTDPGLTEAYLTAAHDTTVKIGGDRTNYRFRRTSRRFGQFQLANIDNTTMTEYQTDPLSDVLVVRMTRGIRTRVDLDDRWGPGDLGLQCQPNEPFWVRYTPARYAVAIVSVRTLAAAARNRPDDDPGPLHFDSLRPNHPTAARHWVKTVDYVAQHQRDFPEAMTQPLFSGAVTRLLGAALLTTFANTWTTEPHHQDRVDATPTTLTRAIAFIETNVDVDISVVDIARASYVTVRAIQIAFRRHLETTPMAYLRRVRLERAHEQLRGANPGDGTTITQVAARWGFTNPSRFAAIYQRTYGKPPSHTLRN